MTCHITGSVVIPDGSSAANRKITFRKEDFTVTTDGGLTVVPEYVTVYTDASGNVSFDLMPGTYSGFYVTPPDGRLPFRFNVPSDTPTADFASLIVTTSVSEDQGLIDLVNQAYDAIQNGVTVWGGVTGNLSDQTDLQTVLDSKADNEHQHSFEDVSGTGTRLSDSDAAFSVTDESGYRAIQVDNSGVTRIASLQADQANIEGTLEVGLVQLSSDLTVAYGSPDWIWSVRDMEGNIVTGTRSSDLVTVGNFEGTFAGVTTVTEPPMCLSTDHIRTIMHRGLSSIYPEETLPAYKACVETNRFVVEGDIQWSSDGVPVMCHDDTVDRTSDGTGAISSLTLAELKALDFGSWKNSAFAGTQILTFAELCAYCRKMNLYMVIEAKKYGWTTTQIQQVVDIANQEGMWGRIEWQSFDITNLQKFALIDPKAPLHYLKGTLDSAMITSGQSIQTGLNQVWLSPSFGTVTQELVASVHAAGLRVAPNTVDSESNALSLIAMGVDGIFTNSLNIQQVILTSEGL